MTTDRAGGRTGRVEKDGVEGIIGRKGEEIGGLGLGFKSEARKVVDKPPLAVF